MWDGGEVVRDGVGFSFRRCDTIGEVEREVWVIGAFFTVVVSSPVDGFPATGAFTVVSG